MKLCPICEAEYPDEVQHCIHDGETLVKLKAQPIALIGTVLNKRFRLVERIGVGGMGTVYKAIQEPAERPVAVKILHPELASDKEAIRRFFNEARVVSRLRHPHTITLYDFGQADTGELYIVMELMTGVSLTHLIERKSLTLPEVLEITDQICQSLEEAHDLGIIHRDLKPDNVFVDQIGHRHLVKVLDFGIAKVPDATEHLTRTGMVFGTPAYMSPEQAQGHDLDTRSDIYTLGIVLYHALAGEPPFTADTPMQVALKQVTTAPRPINDMSLYRPLPLGLSALVSDMLEKEPAKRPQMLGEVRERLLRVARDLPGMKIEVLPDSGEILVASGPVDTLPEAWKGDTLEAPSLRPAEVSPAPAKEPESERITQDLAPATDYSFRGRLVAGGIALIGLVAIGILISRMLGPDVGPSSPAPGAIELERPSPTGAVPRPDVAHGLEEHRSVLWPTTAVQEAVARAQAVVRSLGSALSPDGLPAHPAGTAAEDQGAAQGYPLPGQGAEPPSRRSGDRDDRASTRPRRRDSPPAHRRRQGEQEGSAPQVRPVLLPPVTIPLSED